MRMNERKNRAPGEIPLACVCLRRLPDRHGKRAAEATLVQVTRLMDQSSIQIDSRGPGTFRSIFLTSKKTYDFVPLVRR
ncbi:MULTISPECIES: hypothetical protein [Sporolactobacillus]|uniref:hypothetical protein n=1 Tax=Sporolactobacillus TaxID=2077 RepID=UPI0011605057|nr:MULTISPECIES: hypothetical protein [Sporolactobacillus]MCQ2010203.1 hypothetical protein [Sporolactobacillus sp. STSJ-5]